MSMENLRLNKDIVRELLRYDENTGDLYWNYRDKRWFKRRQDYLRWNSRFSGKLAGGSCTVNGNYTYKNIKIFGKTYSQHRLVWFWIYGEWPEQSVDHVNKISSDNRGSNLRDVPHGVNMRNKRDYKSNTSGIKGVALLRGLWRARINVNGKEKHLGVFTDKFEAICARKSAEILYNFT